MLAAEGTTHAVAFDDGAQSLLTEWGSTGPAMVCVHGMTSSRYSWARFAGCFSNAFRVFAYDQRGHGDCAHVLGPMSLQQGVADLHAVLRAIGDNDITLVGHSWGGAIVVGAGRASSIARVLAIDPLVYADPAVDWYGEYLADFDADRRLPQHELQRELRRRYSEFGWSTQDIDAKLHAVANMVIEPLERLASENDVAGGGWDLRDQLVNYPKPLLLALADASDSTVTAAEREWIARNGGPLVQMIEYAGLGHSLHRTHFERFAADADFWLRK